MKQVVDEQTGRVTWVPENDEDRKFFKQIEDQQEDHQEDEDSTSSEEQEQQPFVKSGEDKQAVVSTAAPPATPAVVTPNPTRTANENYLLMVYHAVKAGQKNLVLPGGIVIDLREKSFAQNVWVNKELAPLIKPLLKVLEEQHISFSSIANNGWQVKLEEIITDLLTPAEVKAQIQKEEQERKAALEKEKQASINLENIDLNKISQTYTYEQMRDFLHKHLHLIYILDASFTHSRYTDFNGQETYPNGFALSLAHYEKKQYDNEVKRIKGLYDKLIEDIGVQDHHPLMFTDYMAKGMALSKVLQDRIKSELENEQRLTERVNKEREEYKDNSKYKELEAGLTDMILRGSRYHNARYNDYNAQKAAKWLDMSIDDILELRKNKKTYEIREVVQKRLAELGYLPPT
jgi:hypothetical protein